jgi:hypothetical protein
MNEEGRKLTPLAGLSYAGIAGMLACARCITMSLSVVFVGLLILMIVASRSRNAWRLKPWPDISQRQRKHLELAA